MTTKIIIKEYEWERHQQISLPPANYDSRKHRL
jgi:hypothetical protein